MLKNSAWVVAYAFGVWFCLFSVSFVNTTLVHPLDLGVFSYVYVSSNNTNSCLKAFYIIYLFYCVYFYDTCLAQVWSCCCKAGIDLLSSFSVNFTSPFLNCLSYIVTMLTFASFLLSVGFIIVSSDTCLCQ